MQKLPAYGRSSWASFSSKLFHLLYKSCTYKLKILFLLEFTLDRNFLKKLDIFSLIFLEKTLNENERNKRKYTQATIRIKLTIE